MKEFLNRKKKVKSMMIEKEMNMIMKEEGIGLIVKELEKEEKFVELKGEQLLLIEEK